MIRALDPATDRDAVLDLYQRAADYVQLETGADAGPGAVAGFFASAPPGKDPTAALRLGAFEAGRLVGVSDMAFGYPEEHDAYIGLLMLDASARGLGLGRQLLDRNVAEARARGANRLLVAVLEDNPRGQAFWAREGFVEERRFPPARIRERTRARVRMTRPL